MNHTNISTPHNSNYCGNYLHELQVGTKRACHQRNLNNLIPYKYIRIVFIWSVPVLCKELCVWSPRRKKTNNVDNDEDEKQDSGLSCWLDTSPPLVVIGSAVTVELVYWSPRKHDNFSSSWKSIFPTEPFSNSSNGVYNQSKLYSFH